MNGQSIFSPRVLATWISAMALIFALTFWLIANSGGEDSAIGVHSQPNSISAIGYAGLEELVRQQDLQRSASPFSRKLVIILDPPSGTDLEAMKDEDNTVTLWVLPKWLGWPDPQKQDWISAAEFIPESIPQHILDVVGAPRGEKSEFNGGIVRMPLTATPTAENAAFPPITLNQPTQVMANMPPGFLPVLSTPYGIYLGCRDEQSKRVCILADPDLFANFGLQLGDNANASLAIVRALSSPGGGVTFGMVRRQNPSGGSDGGTQKPTRNALRLLTDWPYVIATLNTIAALLLLVWAVAARFGPPARVPARDRPGRAGLVWNAGQLLALAGYQSVLMRRWVETQIQGLAYRFNAPRNLSQEGRIAWLDRMAKARGLQPGAGQAAVAAALASAKDDAKHGSDQVRAAREVFEWKKELLDGSFRSTRNH